jgi:hypothetical protein
LVVSEPVTLEIVDPDGCVGLLGEDEFYAYWQLRQSIVHQPRTLYGALAWCLIPRGEGTLRPPSRREQITRFVSDVPGSVYSLYLRYTFLACRDDGYTAAENALCEEYRQFLQKNAMGFFPESMRGVFAAQP